jgi:hypothetical protein
MSKKVREKQRGNSKRKKKKTQEGGENIIYK